MGVFTAVAYSQQRPFEISAGTGIETNQFNWSIAGNAEGQNPNILSELKFHRVISYGSFVKGSYKATRAFKIDASYQRNQVTGGIGTDVDYAADNRREPTFNEAFRSDQGTLQLFKLGGQYAFWKTSKIQLAGGLHYHSRSSRYYLLSDQLSILASTYAAKFKGGAISLVADYQASTALSIGALAGYSIGDYKGFADWNLIDLFKHPVSFVQTGNTQGMAVKVKVHYSLRPRLGVELSGLYDHIAIFEGTDLSYLSNGRVLTTRFNGGRLRSYAVNVGATYCF